MITVRAVSRLTGIAAKTLRAWEQRFGFPVSVRSAAGQRQFYRRDMPDLVEIARRIGLGELATTVFASVRNAQQTRRAQTHSASGVERGSDVALALRYLMEDDVAALERWVDARLLEHGVGKFSHDLAHPLMEAVGELWREGVVPVYAESAFTSVMQRALFSYTNSMAAKSVPTKPVNPLLVLFASPPTELHSMGLTFGNAMFNAERIASVMLLGGLPTADIARAAKAYKARVVALSASLAYPTKVLKQELIVLRKLLPDTVDIWLGGAGSYLLAGLIPGVDVMNSWEDALEVHKRYSKL